MQFPDFNLDVVTVTRLWREREVTKHAIELMRPVFKHLKAGDVERAYASLARCQNRLIRQLSFDEDQGEALGILLKADRYTDPHRKPRRVHRINLG